jgi:DNA repair protein SbcD/Mre11
MFRFIHVADIHLDSPLCGLERYEGAPAEAIRQASRRALANLVQLAIDRSVAMVLVAGDLYDGDWKDHKTGLFFVAQMVKLREAGIPVFLIAGNHDAANKMTRSLPLPDNVRMLSPKHPQTVCLEELGVAVHGQSFATAATMEDLSAAYPTALGGLVNLGLLHTSVTGREGHEPYAPCTLDGLRAKQYDYWALGHVHKQEFLCKEPWVVFPGNVQGRHIRESGPKGCMLVEVDDRHRLQPEFQPLDVLRWQRCWVDASGAPTVEELLDRVRRRLAELVAASDGLPLAVRVETAGPCTAHRQVAARPQQWTNDVRSLALDVGAGDLWIEKVRLSTSLPADLDDARSADGPVGELARWIDQLKSDPETLARLVGSELTDLYKKLPAELTEGPDALDLQRPEAMQGLLDQVRQMLVSQLSSRENLT